MTVLLDARKILIVVEDIKNEPDRLRIYSVDALHVRYAKERGARHSGKNHRCLQGKVASGIGIYAVSAVSGAGIDALTDYLKPRKTIIFLGSSGVGKSSLVNTLAGSDIMAVNEIRKNDSKGRHTTTHRQLIMLDSGVMIIDTPGMRELGMWDVSQGLGEAFGDVEQYFGKCRFKDYKHQTEPGCAVKAAIENDELPPDRWYSYLKLKREAKFSDDKVAYLRQRQQRHKELAKRGKQMKINGGKQK